MINRNQIIRQADDDGVPAATVERDYVLNHALAAIANCEQAQQIVFKGGTALRLCYFEDYRYSADLDFSLIGEFVENTAHRPVFRRYGDQAEGDCLVYTLEEIAAEKLRCVIQRLQCRDLYDIHELFVVHGLDPSFAWPLFERKARHRRIDPGLFPARFEERLPDYRARWTNELSDHVSGEPPQFETLLRAVRRALRDVLHRRAPLLGVIANGFKSGRRGGYGYGYGYDYTPAKADPPTDTPASPNGAAAAEAPPVPSAGG